MAQIQSFHNFKRKRFRLLFDNLMIVKTKLNGKLGVSAHKKTPNKKNYSKNKQSKPGTNAKVENQKSLTKNSIQQLLFLLLT